MLGIASSGCFIDRFANFASFNNSDRQSLCIVVFRTPTLVAEYSPAIWFLIMSGKNNGTPWLPPRWFIYCAWKVHRAIYLLTGGRRGLSIPKPGQFGLMRLTTVGRRSGKERAVILGYYEDGQNLVTLAMNGWGEGEPAWWLNLLAQPAASVELKGGARLVRAYAASGEERARLWTGFNEYSGWGAGIDAYAKRRSSETAVVVLEPRSEPH